MENLPTKRPDSSNSTFILPKPSVRADEVELWISFRSGRREALNAIFQKYARALYSYGRNITADRDIISDCIQDIFLELWIKRATLSTEVNSIKYYLIKALRRRILRNLSSARTRTGQPISDDYSNEIEFNIEFSLIQAELSEELSSQLKISVATLSKGQQEAVYLKFYENMTYEEVASVMHTNVKAVYNLIGKAIISLRKYFSRNPIQQE
jgi:RNA polymerase sigma factor (sigma-70 family)